MFSKIAKLRKYKHKNKTHIIIIIALLIFVIGNISRSSQTDQNEDQNEIKTQAQTKVEFQQLESLFIAVKLQRSHHLMNKPKNFQTTIVLLLILLSNDVSPNPGPIESTKQNCSLCNKITHEEDSLQCSTCSLWCHLNCTAAVKQNSAENLRNASFQWICSSKNCNPNLNQVNNLQSNILSPNRYNILPKDQEDDSISPKVYEDEVRKLKVKRPVAKKIEVKRKASSNYNYLLNELPKISPKDFIGKDLCKGCDKEVKENQQAIFCDICERWIHRFCSDMSKRIYTQCKTKTTFIWACNKCRRDEEVNSDKADTSILDEDEMPENWDTIQKKRKEMLVIHMNCRSVLNKEEELENIIKELDPDIVTLTETWFDESAPMKTCVPDGYKIIRKDRNENFKQKYGVNRGGGVAVLYKENIKVEKNKYATDPVEEILWCHVRTKESFMLGVVYRSEYTDILGENDENESKLEENIRKVSESSTKVIVTGDYNIDMTDHAHKNTEFIKSTYEAYGLKQYMKKPTRIDKSTSKATIIDHVWATEEANLVKTTGTFIALSDHLGQYVRLNQSKLTEEKVKIKFRDYKNYDVNAFNKELQRNIDRSQIDEQLQRNDVNSATATLVKVIQDTANSHAPLVEIYRSSIKKKIPWFTLELRELIQRKNEFLQDMYSHGLESYKKRIKTLSNKITQMKRNLKEKYLSEKLEDAQNDSKKCWNILNAVTNRTKVKDTIEPDMITQAKANEYNKFFATIGIEIQKKLGIKIKSQTPSNETENNCNKSSSLKQKVQML